MKTLRSKKTKKIQSLIAFGWLVIAASPAHAVNYSFSDMGGLNDLANPIYSRGINNNGHVVGIQGENAVVWNGTSWSALVNIDGTTSGGLGINDSGQVAGYASIIGQDASYGVRWNNGVPTALDTLNNFDLAAASNNAGQVVGTIWSNDQTSVPATWAAGGTAMTLLPTLGGNTGYVFNNHSINNTGVIVGSTQLTGGDALHATAWIDNVAHDLGTLGGTNSEANAVNSLGQIVGDAMIADDTPRPVLWNDYLSTPIDLGTLGGAGGMAIAINDNGLIAGWSDTPDGTSHLTLWDHGQVIDLNQFIPAELVAAGWKSIQGGSNNSVLSSDYLDINNEGVIISTLYDDADHAIPILLTPTAVPVPGALWLFGSALAGFMGAVKHKKKRIN